MNKCQFAEVRNNECYCLGTKEIDICPSEGDPYSSRCYYPKEKGDKEIHFDYDLKDAKHGKNTKATIIAALILQLDSSNTQTII